MTPKWFQNEPKIMPEWSPNDPKMIPNDPQMTPKWSQNDPKMINKWSRNDAQMIQNDSQMGTKSLPKRFQKQGRKKDAKQKDPKELKKVTGDIDPVAASAN